MTHGGAVRRARWFALMCWLVFITGAEYTPRVGVVKRDYNTAPARELAVTGL
jgi:hypothetical protein